MNNSSLPYYLDTDMGNDDMLAITMLISRGVNLRGISTVFGVATAAQGAQNLTRLLQYLSCGIPVYQGASQALTRDWKVGFPPIDCVRANGLTLLQGLVFPKPSPQKPGNLDEFGAAIMQESTAINLIAIGPLTNIATLIQKYGEDFKKQINSLTIMGGALTVPGIVPPDNLVEYNMYLDPLAAKVVFESGIAITMVPIDATRFVPASNDVIKSAQNLIPTTKAGKVIKALTINNQGDFNSYYDPLLAGCLLDPTIITQTMKGTVKVTTQGENIGQTQISVRTNGNVTAIVKVAAAKFNMQLLNCIRQENILLISATHGNEGFSLPIIQKLSSEFGIDYLIGNPKALKKTIRCTDGDLNRSGPGDINSPIYEQRRAATIINKARRYDVTLDIHGTVSDSGIFLILSDPNWENIELAKKLDVENVVMWPGLMPTGPLSQFIPRCLEIECGPKQSPVVAKELERILRGYLEGKPRKVKQNFYIVTGQTKGDYDPELRDFEKTTKYGDPFYPILCGNQYPGITCYQMQRLNDTL